MKNKESYGTWSVFPLRESHVANFEEGRKIYKPHSEVTFTWDDIYIEKDDQGKVIMVLVDVYYVQDLLKGLENARRIPIPLQKIWLSDKALQDLKTHYPEVHAFLKKTKLSSRTAVVSSK